MIDAKDVTYSCDMIGDDIRCRQNCHVGNSALYATCMYKMLHAAEALS